MKIEPLNLFYREFCFLKDYFKLFDLSINEAKTSNEEFIYNPGVYVYYHSQEGILRIGRDLKNSRKRALEHIRDDTGGIMKNLSKDENTRLMLFNVIDQKYIHWIAALEIYFELNLKPKIPAKRLG